MPTLFTRIIQGELPGRFVWKDEHCVAFLSIEPLRPGHTLLVPREEIDHWIDVPDALHAHLAKVAKELGIALQAAFKPNPSVPFPRAPSPAPLPTDRAGRGLQPD